jgi:3-oxoacyl-[acyl-carrier-protein] synthase-1
MGDAAAYASVALEDAIAHAGLNPAVVSHPRTGLIMGSGGGSPEHQIEAADTLRSRGVRRVGPYQVTRTMSSTVSACLSTRFKVRGLNYSISSACATSAHCIGAAAQQIAWGLQDVMFAGGGEELSWGMTSLFDGMGALSTKRNDSPQAASRAYDADRDGFVIAGGGGALVLEALEHAQARGATVLAEIVGYGATSDGADMVAPSGVGAVDCMRQAIAGLDAPIDYINTHGTSTPLGDLIELRALREVFGEAIPPFSSTKSLSGHSLGAAGVQEAIYCLLMLRGGFIAGSVNVDTPDPELAGAPLVTATRETRLRTVLSNSFGFGGTNACLVLQNMS